MFWADKLLENVKGKQLVNDSTTPSGIVHMGSLKGPVIHDVLFKSLKEKGTEAKNMYGFDDADPIDGLPEDLQKTHSEYFGVPIFIAPAPESEGTFGDYFSDKMKSLLNALGVEAEYYKTSEFYKNGTFNKGIEFVLEHVQEIRDIYSKIYKKEIAKDWFPLQVICPNCGKLGTTKVTAWDGKEVTFECRKDLVKWAQGCGHIGKISPYDGKSKMPYKVEWAVKWWTFKITIEGAGKDHLSAGGTYDVAAQICTDVFKVPHPLKFSYEFFLSGGKKMSSSKGIGMTGEELLEVLGPQRVRFLMIKSPPNQTVEFSPRGTDAIPRVFDEYQKAAQENTEAFKFSQVGEVEEVPSIRFQVLAQWVQMPNMEEEIKKEGLEAWAKYAKVWVEKYAPEEEKFSVQKELPIEVKKLSNDQKHYLKMVSERFDQASNEVDLEVKLYNWIQESMLKSNEAFAAIYISLLGKDHGPKAASLIRSLDKEFAKKRFEEASR